MAVIGKRTTRLGTKSTAVGFAILLVAAIFAWSACGDDSSSQEDVPTSATAAATSTPSEQPTQAPPTEAPEPEPTATARADRDLPQHDKDIRGIEAWINSDPTTIAELNSQGKVVLVDFWTYTCVNCLRTLPFLREWQEKYADNGLVILGVHAPEFDFEKELENVQQAVDDEKIEWPVALDNEMSTWRAFNNRYWPAKYLIGTDGKIHYTHFGEGAYRETELEIRSALQDAGYDVSAIPVGEIENTQRDSRAQTVTRELYGGYDRNYSVYGIYAAQDEYYVKPDVEVEYLDRYAEYSNYPAQQWVLQGLWRNEREAIVHARETEGLEDYIAFRFQGRSANVVIDPPELDEFKVYVFLDGEPLPEDYAGEDIVYDESGRAYFDVNEGRMYKIVETPEYGNHILKLSSDSDNFAIFAFTFGIYEGGF